MFAPDHAKAASELVRVCKPGGTIAIAGEYLEDGHDPRINNRAQLRAWMRRSGMGFQPMFTGRKPVPHSQLAPEAFKGFIAFDAAAISAGAIPLKYKELMAVAVALTTQCTYCIEIHAKRAKNAGATEQELAETTLLAAALRAGGAMTHGTHTLVNDE